MGMDRAQKAILAVTTAVLALLVLFPPWQQAAARETAYRKDLGRGLVFSPPSAVSVDCYFVGCKTAPAAYFHVLLSWDLFLEQIGAVVGVSILVLWIFRIRRDGTRASLVSRKIRLQLSVLAALLVPIEGTFPMVSDLARIPWQLTHTDELLFVPMILLLVMYSFAVLVIYVLASAVLWIGNRVLRR